MEFKDYYAALGLEPDTDTKTIKQTYRKLARQYHPDVNPGDQTAEERFKEVNEAYQVLSDPEKRQKYDRLRQQYRQWQQYGGGNGKSGGFNWSPWQDAANGNAYTYTWSGSPEDMRDIFGEDMPFSDFFSSIFGGGGGVGPDVATRTYSTRTARPRRGQDAEVAVQITLEEAFHGTNRVVQAGERRIEARIPPGVRTGSRVRLSGQGYPGTGDQPAGDLYLVVEVLPHPQFERDGDDLSSTIALDIFTAAAGGEARVQTIDGTVTLKIPPRTQSDRVFRLRGKGLPRLDNPDQRGDLYARTQLVLPDDLSDAEIETLRQMKR